MANSIAHFIPVTGALGDHDAYGDGGAKEANMYDWYRYSAATSVKTVSHRASANQSSPPNPQTRKTS